MGIVYSQFFVIFFIILRNRLAHYGQKVRSGALMRTAMTETRVARDGDEQHIKRGPGSSGLIKLFKTFLDFFIIINFFYHIASSEIYIIISITVKEFYTFKKTFGIHNSIQ